MTITETTTTEPVVDPDELYIHLACCEEVDQWVSGAGPKPATSFCGLPLEGEGLYKGKNVDNCSLCRLVLEDMKPICPIKKVFCHNCAEHQ